MVRPSIISRLIINRLIIARPISLLVAASAALGAQGQSESAFLLPASLLQDRFRPHIKATAGNIDPDTAFALKLHSVGQSPYVFWRGTKDLFFDWSRQNLARWRDTNPEDWVICHGDVHLGNVGTYPVSLTPPTLGVGLVDYDDADRLPPEYDLLQIAITLKLIAAEQKLPLDSASDALVAALEAYVTALAPEVITESSPRASTTPPADTSPSALLAKDPALTKLLTKSGKAALSADIDEFVSEGKFRAVVKSKAGKIKELLRPMTDRPALAAALFDAATRSQSLAAELGKPANPSALEANIIDAAWRVRIGSSGSQGLSKLLVLAKTPAGERLIYLKQAIPSPAARAQLVALRPPPAKRVADSVSRGAPGWLGNTFTSLLGQEFWVSVKDPWSDELDHADVDSAKQLVAAGRVMGLAVAKLHAATTRDLTGLRARVFESDPARPQDPTAGRLRPYALEQFQSLSTQYIAFQNAGYDSFLTDPAYLQAEKTVRKLLNDAARQQ